jgi:circadian clock protein KaiB
MDESKNTEQWEARAHSLENSKETYLLRLYVSGATSRSLQAIQNIKAICGDHLKGRYELEVIDVYQQPELLKNDQIIAVPTLIKQRPQPLRKFIGDMSDQGRILVGLGLVPNKDKVSMP